MLIRPIQKNIRPVLTSIFHRKCSLSNLSKFKKELIAAKEVVVISGAGISVESGIPTFRKEGSWRDLDTSVLATPSAFREDPALVWEFYHYRRELVLQSKPSAGHLAIAEYEARHATDKRVTVITQNVDGLHARAGSKYVVELHGNLFKTRCTKCNQILDNTDSPICEALRGRGSPSSKELYSNIPEKNLPHCKRPACGGLLRPHVVWFGEHLDLSLVDILDPVVTYCDILLLVGTSSTVYPAAAFPYIIAAGGSIVAEFNTQPPPKKLIYDYYFTGPCGISLPIALSDI